jgi:hypothetical protein
LLGGERRKEKADAEVPACFVGRNFFLLFEEGDFGCRAGTVFHDCRDYCARSLAFGSSPLLYLIQGKFDDAGGTNPD